MDSQKIRKNLIEWLTKSLRLDIRFYGKSFSWLSLSHASGIIRGMATTLLMGRWIIPETLGQFRYMLALFGLAGIFSLAGIHTSVIKGVSTGDTIVARITLKRILQFTPLGTIMLLLLAFERYMHHEYSVAYAIAFAGIAFVPFCASSMYSPILTGLAQIKQLSISTVVMNLIYSVAFVILLFFEKNLVAITIAYFGLDIVLKGSYSWYVYRKLEKKGSPDQHMRIGHHMTTVGIVQTIALQLNNILLQRFWGYQTLAAFNIACVIPDQIKSVSNTLSGTFLQRLARHERNEKYLKATRRHFWIMFIAIAISVLAYIVTIPVLLPWLFPQYADAVYPSIVYSLGLLGIPCVIGLYYFQAHNDVRKLWQFYTANTLIQIVSSIALVPFFGGWGAIWSRVLTRVGSLPFSYPVLGKSSNKKTEIATNDEDEHITSQ